MLSQGRVPHNAQFEHSCLETPLQYRVVRCCIDLQVLDGEDIVLDDASLHKVRLAFPNNILPLYFFITEGWKVQCLENSKDIVETLDSVTIVVREGSAR